MYIEVINSLEENTGTLDSLPPFHTLSPSLGFSTIPNQCSERWGESYISCIWYFQDWCPRVGGLVNVHFPGITSVCTNFLRKQIVLKAIWITKRTKLLFQVLSSKYRAQITFFFKAISDKHRVQITFIRSFYLKVHSPHYSGFSGPFLTSKGTKWLVQVLFSKAQSLYLLTSMEPVGLDFIRSSSHKYGVAEVMREEENRVQFSI